MTDDDRIQTVTELLPLMAALPPRKRVILSEMARSVFDHSEAIKRRRALLRRYHRINYKTLSDKAAAKIIADHIEKRSGTSVSSTGSNVQDRAIDKILLISPVIAERTIRLDLAPG